MQSTLMINQSILAGNQFSGNTVPADAMGPAIPVKRPPPAGKPSSWSYNGLTGGGLFDFFVPGSPGLPIQRYPLHIERIVLNLGDAVTWTLDILTDDGNGNALTLNLLTQAVGNSYINFGLLGRIMPGEKLVLTTAGATSDMHAQIVASKMNR